MTDRGGRSGRTEVLERPRVGACGHWCTRGDLVALDACQIPDVAPPHRVPADIDARAVRVVCRDEIVDRGTREGEIDLVVPVLVAAGFVVTPAATRLENVGVGFGIHRDEPLRISQSHSESLRITQNRSESLRIAQNCSELIKITQNFCFWRHNF